MTRVGPKHTIASSAAESAMTPLDNPSDIPADLLKGVSRSFYLTIRVLPGPVRGPIQLAYLLARAADTIADTGELPLKERLEHLARFRARLDDRSAEPSTMLSSDAVAQSRLEDPESELLLALPRLLDAFDNMPEDDRQKRSKRTVDTLIQRDGVRLDDLSGQRTRDRSAL